MDNRAENRDLLYESFKTKLEAVSGECYRARTFTEAADLIDKVLKEKQLTNVSIVDSKLIKACNLAGKLSNSGIEVYTDQINQVTSFVQAGITEIKWAIAELGTLVQYAVDVNERLCSAFTPVHVALVQTFALLPNLMETLATINDLPQIPGFVGFITGPSRTSDIERVLTIGVHGPEQLIVVFVDEQVQEVA